MGYGCFCIRCISGVFSGIIFLCVFTLEGLPWWISGVCCWLGLDFVGRALLFLYYKLLFDYRGSFIDLPSRLPPASSRVVASKVAMLKRRLRGPCSIKGVHGTLTGLSPGAETKVASVSVRPARCCIGFRPHSSRRLSLVLRSSAVV